MTPSPQVHTESPSPPRMVELYLEAGAALLMARRPADCMVLCEEVITSTLELLPAKVMLEAEETEDVGAAGGEKVKTLLWTGAAYLLQGHSHTHLKDWKQAVTHYTRYHKMLCNLCTSACFESSECKIVLYFPGVSIFSLRCVLDKTEVRILFSSCWKIIAILIVSV